jgi:hypothetical protein
MQSAEEQCVRFAELGVSVALLSGRPTQRSRVCFALIATNLMSRNDLSRMDRGSRDGRSVCPARLCARSEALQLQRAKPSWISRQDCACRSRR